MINRVDENIIWAKAMDKSAAGDNENITPYEQAKLVSEAKHLLKNNNAVLVAHYYTDAALQNLAEQTGGCVADSLEMARFGKHHSATTLVVAGVRFMGETAKILSPEKKVLMPDLGAECSLDLACPSEIFSAFCDANPDRTVVVYANTSAEVKARADWVVTSSNAVEIIKYLKANGEKIIWAPDKHLGDYVQKQTQADMLLWQGSCIVHEAFKAQALRELMALNPEAAVLVHPESPADVIALADVVGSTTTLIEAARTLPNEIMIVATDNGILHKMKQIAPQKSFIEAPTGGSGATCESCAHCPWMAMNSIQKLVAVLKNANNEIFVDEQTRHKACIPLERMLAFRQHQQQRVAPATNY